MRVGRKIIISAIVALGAAGSILTSSAAIATVAHAPASHVVVTTASGSRSLYYHC